MSDPLVSKNRAAPTGRARVSRAYVNDRAGWSDEWATPADFFAVLDAEFVFQLDVCAARWSAKYPRFFSRDEDGLSRDWGFSNWLNPPYSNIGPWLAKARAEAAKGATTVALVPCVPDRKWWAEHVEGKAEIRHVAGRRLYFTAAEGEQPKRAPFPSCVVIYRPAPTGRA